MYVPEHTTRTSTGGVGDLGDGELVVVGGDGGGIEGEGGELVISVTDSCSWIRRNLDTCTSSQSVYDPAKNRTCGAIVLLPYEYLVRLDV